MWDKDLVSRDMKDGCLRKVVGACGRLIGWSFTYQRDDNIKHTAEL